MAWSDAITAVFEVVKAVFGYETSGQTKAQRTIEEQVHDLEQEWDDAMAKNDLPRATRVLADLRKLRAQLQAGR